MERVILHCDMDNFFATVEEKFNPELRKIPFAVCGDPQMRHSIVMAKNSIAKRFGVSTGLSFRQAREICPSLSCVTADYSKYLKEAKAAREIYKKYTDNIVPYGLDEAWLDLSETGVTMNEGRQIAELIRLEIRYSRSLSASVGVSDNFIFAKIGSEYNKPNGTTVITRDNYKSIVWKLPVSELLFVGKKRQKVLATGGIFTIGDLAEADPLMLRKLLGKSGYDIWRFADGDDRSFKPENDSIESVGNTITPPADLNSDEDVSAILYLISGSVSTRLQKHRLKACCVSVSMKDNRFNSMTRQCTLPYPTDNLNVIFNCAYRLFERNYKWTYPLRSLGIRADNLISRKNEQLSFYNTDECVICVNIDERLKDLTARFGNVCTEKSATIKDW